MSRDDREELSFVLRRFSMPWHGLWPVALAVALAVVMTWPLALHLGSDIPQDGFDPDPLLTVWHEAWIGHALLNQPLDLFQANRFWPEEDSLAFTDVTLGYAPAAVVSAQGLDAAVVVYNLLFLFSYALAFLGAYLLAHELGAGRVAAVVAGTAFAYAPFRLAQDGHLAVISSGGIPLAIFLLVRGYRRRSGKLVLAGWLVSTWQMTLGFTLGVPLVYLLLALGAVATAYWLRGRPALGRAVVGASAAGVCVLVLVTFFQAQPYLRVRDEHPEARRTPELVTYYSPPLRGFLAAPEDGYLWNGPTTRARNSLRAPIEQALFPGIVILVLAGFGLFSSAYSATLRFWLGAGTVTCALLSLGLRDDGHALGGVMPYRLLYELGPGWDGLRTPGRVHTLTSLGLALLAAAGAAVFLRAVRTRRILREPFRTHKTRETAALVTAELLIAVILVEGLGPTHLTRVPPIPPGQLTAPDPQLHLPSHGLTESRYSYWSIAGFPRIVNGYGAFTPSRLAEVRRVSAGFPDAKSVAFLRELGVRTVILHPELTTGTEWEGAAERPTRGLPLVREKRGEVVLYRLDD